VKYNVTHCTIPVVSVVVPLLHMTVPLLGLPVVIHPCLSVCCNDADFSDWVRSIRVRS